MYFNINVQFAKKIKVGVVLYNIINSLYYFYSDLQNILLRLHPKINVNSCFYIYVFYFCRTNFFQYPGNYKMMA